MNTINFFPIIIASLVGFVISSLWYSPFLFGKEWLNLRGISNNEIISIKEKGLIKSYTIQIISTIIVFTVLAFFISIIDNIGSSDGAFIGLLTWLGFIVPNSISNILWKKEPFILSAIEAVNSLLILTIGGAIIGAW